MSNRKQEFRERILGTSAPLPSSRSLTEVWVESAASPVTHIPASHIPASEVPRIQVIEPVPAGTRYHNEDFVRGKIENWAGRPAGANHAGLVLDEEAAQRIEILKQSVVPTDHTDADVTNRTLSALGLGVARVLISFHTTRLTLQQIANKVGVSYGTCHARLTQGHIDFTERWEDEKQRLNTELRSLAPAVDPSINAAPMRTLPRDKPVSGPWVNKLEAAPVLGYRKTQELG